MVDPVTWICWSCDMDWLILKYGLVDSKIWIDWSCDMDWYIVKHQPIHVSIFCPYFKNLTEICDFDSIKSQFIPFCYFSSLLFWWHTTLNSDIIRKIRFCCNPQVKRWFLKMIVSEKFANYCHSIASQCGKNFVNSICPYTVFGI